MIWGLLATGFAFITTIIISLGRISNRAEEITSAHRQELLMRNQDKVKK